MPFLKREKGICDVDLGTVDTEVGHIGCLAQDILRHTAVAALVIFLEMEKDFILWMIEIDSYIHSEDCVHMPVSDLEWEKCKEKKLVCRIVFCVYFAKFCVDVLASPWP